MRYAAFLLLALTAFPGDAIEIPFRWTPGQIEVQVSIEGRAPIWCIVDSGAEFSMLDDETAKALGLGPRRRQGGRERIDGLTMVIGPLRLAGQSVTLWALDNFRRQKREIRGVIGCELFERYVVAIDFQRHVLVLSEPASFRAPKSASSYPITFSGRLPVIEADLTFGGRVIRSRLMIDTGASQAVILRHPFATEHGLFGSEDKTTTSETVASGQRAFVTLSAEAIRLGKWTFPKPAVKAYGSRAGAGGYTATDGLLGNDILRHFLVVFDYSRKRLLLTRR